MGVFETVFAEMARDIVPLTREEIDRNLADDRDRAAQGEVEQRQLADEIDRFDVVSGYKLNLSGLSQRSHGRGDKKTTVYHALCLKDLGSGRFKRTARSFLCGASHGSFGYIIDPASGLSCPRCLELTEKHHLKLSEKPILKALSNQY